MLSECTLECSVSARLNAHECTLECSWVHAWRETRCFTTLRQNENTLLGPQLISI